MRQDERHPTQVRPIRFVPNFLKNADGSVLVELGDTIILCTTNVEDNVPNWLRRSRSRQGWLTAEYSMVPSATHSRNKRERGFISGRSHEIQRLIGRSLRGVMDLTKIPDTTFVVDCEVLQADGGTRTAAITGGWIALKIAVDKCLRQGKLQQNPLMENIAAISAGLKDGNLLVDLNYEEDNSADLDINIVMTSSGKIQEIQGTAEGRGFDQKQLNHIIEASQGALQSIFDLQNGACEGQIVEG
jgi:ribonuclease PH